MAFAVDAGAARVRSRVSFGAPAGSPSINPRAEKFDNAAARDELAFPELDCVRALLSSDAIEAAEARAAALGTGADRVLIASGALDEETYLRALGEQLGVAFEPLDGIPRARCPLGDERLIEAATHGMVPLLIDGQLCLTVAPRAAAARCIGGLIKDNPHLARIFRFTCTDRINRFAMRCASTTIADRASVGLKQTWPMLSAALPRWRGSIVPIAIVGLGALAAATLAAAATLYALEIMLADDLPCLDRLAAGWRFRRLGCARASARAARRSAADLHGDSGALPRGLLGRRIAVGNRAARLPPALCSYLTLERLEGRAVAIAP